MSFAPSIDMTTAAYARPRDHRTPQAAGQTNPTLQFNEAGSWTNSIPSHATPEPAL